MRSAAFAALLSLALIPSPTIAASTLSGGLGIGVGDPVRPYQQGSHPSAHASGFFSPRSGIEIGAEVGYHNIGSIRWGDAANGGAVTRTDHYYAFQATPQVRVRPALKRIRPYLSGGFGLYSTQLREPFTATQKRKQTKLGWNGGLGFTFQGNRSPYGVDLSLEWHDTAGTTFLNDQFELETKRLKFYTATVGLAFN